MQNSGSCLRQGDTWDVFSLMFERTEEDGEKPVNVERSCSSQKIRYNYGRLVRSYRDRGFIPISKEDDTFPTLFSTIHGS